MSGYYVIGDKKVGGPFSDSIECDKWAGRFIPSGIKCEVIRVYNGSPHFYGELISNGPQKFATWLKSNSD